MQKWGANVDTTKMLRNDIFDVLGNGYVNGQKNGPVYEQLSTPLQISGETAVKAEENKMPPVVVMAIILISGLLIGYFSYYFKNAPLLMVHVYFIKPHCWSDYQRVRFKYIFYGGRTRHQVDDFYDSLANYCICCRTGWF